MIWAIRSKMPWRDTPPRRDGEPTPSTLACCWGWDMSPKTRPIKVRWAKLRRMQRKVLTSADLLRRTGFDSITETEFLATMDIICDHRLPPPSVFHSQMVHGIATPEDVRKNGWAEPRWVTEPFFKHLHQIHRSRGGDGDGDDNTQYGVLVAAASSVGEAEAVVVGAIKKKLSKALAVPEHDIDESDPLSKYGIDSLVAVELSTWFKKELQSDVGVIDIMNSKSIQQLVQNIVARSSLVRTNDEGESC